MAEQPSLPKRDRPATKPKKLVPVAVPKPWEASTFEPADATALQALVRGDCPPHLQQRAMNFIIYQLCGTYLPAFHPGEDGQRATDMALGKQFVGQQIVGLLKVKTSGEGAEK